MASDLAFIAALLHLDVFALIREAEAFSLADGWGWGPRRAGAVSAAKYGRKYQRKIRIRRA